MRRPRRIAAGALALGIAIGALVLRRSSPSSPGPVSPAGSGAPAASTLPETTELADFRAELRTALRELPRQTDFARLGEEEAHHHPAPLARAGRVLGEIAERVAEDPRRLPAALEFYRACAEDGSLPDPVRALCLANHRRRHEAAGVAAVTEDALPERVRALATQAAF